MRPPRYANLCRSISCIKKTSLQISVGRNGGGCSEARLIAWSYSRNPQPVQDGGIRTGLKSGAVARVARCSQDSEGLDRRCSASWAQAVEGDTHPGVRIRADKERRTMINVPVVKRGGVSSRSLKATNPRGDYLSGGSSPGTLTASHLLRRLPLDGGPRGVRANLRRRRR